MAATIPTCASGNASGVAIQDYMTAFHAAFAAAPGGFTIENVVGAPVTSFTATHSDGWQINYRVSGGTILSLIAPQGGVSNSATPGTPTNAHTEDTLLPAPSGTSTRWQFAQYGDAVFFAINGTANTFSALAFHQGSIYSSADADSGSRGLGTLAYLPADAINATNFLWYCTGASNRKSWIYLRTGAWGNGMAIPIALSGFTTQINGRLGAIGVAAPDTGIPAAGSPLRGVFRYLQVDTTTTASSPLSLLVSSGSNQAWMRLNGSASVTRQVILWNKLITP